MSSEEPTAATSPADLKSEAPSRAARIAAALIVLLIFLIPLAGFVWLRTVSRQVTEDAVVSHAANMLVRYSARTRGKWPDSWDDLEEDFEPADANFGTPSLAAMRELVEIDFDADLPALLSADDGSSSPRLLWLKDQPDTPLIEQTNARLVKSLRMRQQQSPDRPPAASERG